MTDWLEGIEARFAATIYTEHFTFERQAAVAASVNDIPRLLAEVRALRAQVTLMDDVYKGADLPGLVSRVNTAEARVREQDAQLAAQKGVVDTEIAFRDYATSLALTMKREYRTQWTPEETAEYVRLQEIRDDAFDTIRNAALAALEGEE